MTELWLTFSPSPERPDYRVSFGRGRGAGRESLAEGPARIDRTALEREHLAPLRAFIDCPVSGEQLEALGSALTGLLPAATREALLLEIARLEREAAPFRLRLETPDGAVGGLPWEFLRVEGASGGFMALHPLCALLREGGASSRLAALPTETLRVLVAWADPGSARYPPLPGCRQEVASLLSALRGPECRRVEVDELPYASPGGLERQLRARPPHILHFVGHADVRPSGGVLVLHGEQSGAEALLYGEELARWASASPPLRLVVLSACSTTSPTGGVAQALLAKGVPAVVAMQLPLRDATASLFARSFYGALLEPAPVEEAVRQARQALRGAGPDWGVPVLHLGAEDGRLFELMGGGAPPFHLPYLRNPHFTGRGELLEALHRTLQAPGAPVALVGMGGLGKTQLAAEYAHARVSAYPGGVFWLNARDAERLQEEYAGLGRFFDVPDDLPLRERAQRVRDRLAQSRLPVLLILDNLTEATDLLLPGGERCRVLLTTRDRYLARQRCRMVEIPPVSDSDAVALLQTYRPAQGVEERAAAERIAALVGNLPLALALAAHQVERLGTPFVVYAERLAGNRVEVLRQARRRFITATGHDGSIWDAIDLSHRSLAPPADLVLLTASCFAGRGISPELLRRACGLEEGEFEEALADLVDCSLVTREQDGRLGVHELVRTYVRGCAGDGARRAACERTAAVLHRRLETANEALMSRSVEPDLPHCRAAAEFCGSEGIQALLSPLLRELGIYHFHRSDHGTAMRYLDQAVGFQEGTPSARTLRWAAAALMHAGKPELALARAEEALRVAERAPQPNEIERAECLVHLGYVLRMNLRLAPAADCYQHALQLFREHSGPESTHVAECLNNIGALLEEQGQLDAALDHLKAALAIGEAAWSEDHPLTAIRCNNVGRILGKLGRWDEALPYHERARRVYLSAFGAQNVDVAASDFFLAETHRARGEVTEMHACYTAALALLQRLCDRDNPFLRRVAERARSAMEEPPAC
jgi:tetratricopeptide (TPR) repeat protein